MDNFFFSLFSTKFPFFPTTRYAISKSYPHYPHFIPNNVDNFFSTLNFDCALPPFGLILITTNTKHYTIDTALKIRYRIIRRFFNGRKYGKRGTY